MRRRQSKSKISIDGSQLKIGVVVSKFNSDITNNLLKGALATLGGNGVSARNIIVTRVPGSFEIPLACQKLAQTKKFDGLIALGCIIKGETDHNIYISNAVSDGIMEVMLDYNLPIGFGILTPNNLKQAKERSSGKDNKGGEAARAVLFMISEPVKA